MKSKNPKEGELTVEVESQTSKVPSMVYLGAGLAAMAASVALMCMKKKHASLLVGQWASPFLIMGLYNKIVKTEGHDKQNQ